MALTKVNLANIVEGILPVANGGTGTSTGVSPGGSTTQVQYNNAGAFAGSSSLTFDGTTLSTPATLLSAVNPTFTIKNTGSTTGNGVIRFQGSGGTTQGAIGTNYNVGDVGNLEFLNNTTTNMVLSSAGNLGVGTLTPNYKVDIQGNTTGQFWASIKNTNAGASAIGGWYFGNDSYSDVGGVFAGSTGGGGFGGANSMNIGSWRSAPLAMFTNNTERMRIDSSGNVGIGTSTPYSASGCKTIQLTGTDYSLIEQSATTSTANYSNWRQIVRGSVGGHVWQLQLMNDANNAEQTIYEVSRTANSVNYQRWFGGTNEAMRISSSAISFTTSTLSANGYNLGNPSYFSQYATYSYGTWYQAPVNLVLSVYMRGPYTNDFVVYAGQSSSTYYQVFRYGDDINNNTKWSTAIVPIKAGSWFYATSEDTGGPFQSFALSV